MKLQAFVIINSTCNCRSLESFGVSLADEAQENCMFTIRYKEQILTLDDLSHERRVLAIGVHPAQRYGTVSLSDLNFKYYTNCVLKHDQTFS